jgi:hypothetical protein
MKKQKDTTKKLYLMKDVVVQLNSSSLNKIIGGNHGRNINRDNNKINNHTIDTSQSSTPTS